MKILKSLKDFIFYGCTYFTAIATVMLLFSLAETNKALLPDRFLLFLMLSFIFALGSTLLRIEAIPHILAVCLHAAIYNCGFLVFLAVSGMGFSKSIIGTLIFAVVYTVITVTVRLIEKSIKRTSSAKKENHASKSKNISDKLVKKEEKNNEYKNLFS